MGPYGIPSFLWEISCYSDVFFFKWDLCFFLMMFSTSFFLCILNVLIIIVRKSIFSPSVYLLFFVLPVSSLWVYLSLHKCSSMILLES